MKNIRKLLISGGLIITMLSLTNAGAESQTPLNLPLPVVQAVYTEKPPIIDGKLDEECWQKAGVAKDFVEYKTGAPAGQKTEVYLLYDRENLYIGFRCFESELNKLVGTYKNENDPVYLDDAVEIFISPFMISIDRNYYHFVTNVLGTKYSLVHAEVRYGSKHEKLDWDVKTGIEQNAWIAEFRIPFSTLKLRGKNDKFWRVNFCREARASHRETSSWSFCAGSFHNPDRFGILTGIDIDGKFITYKADLRPLVSSVATTKSVPIEVQNAICPQEKPVVVIPQPVYMKLLDKAYDFKITPDTKIIISDNPSKENKKAAEELNNEIYELAGFTLSIEPASKFKATKIKLKNVIVLGEVWTNPVSKRICKEENISITKKQPGEQGYILRVTADYIIVSGSDPIGTYYGVQSLKQLLRVMPAGATETDSFILVAKAAEIYDKPQFKYRAVHLLVDKDSSWFHKWLIERVLARYKFNHIVYECEAGTRWKSRPEVAHKDGIEPDELKKVLAVAKDHFITVTPLVQSLGHCEWIFRYGVNMDFVEDSATPYAYCPLNPKSYEFIFAILDEAIDLFNKPEYLHIGHDEFDMLGEFPVHEECKKVGKVDLFYQDTLKLYNYLKQKGVKTIMWSDVLLRDEFKKKIDVLPKDIMIADWHYAPVSDYPSIDFFIQQGFKTVGCTWFLPTNIEKFSQYGAKKNIYGMMQTTWTGYFGNATAIEREFHQIYAYILAADYFWSPYPKRLEKLPYEPDEILLSRWQKPVPPELITQRFKPVAGILIDLSPFCNVKLIDGVEEKEVGFLGYGAGNDLSKLVTFVMSTSPAQDRKVRLADDVQYLISAIDGIPAGIMLKGPGVAESFPEKVTSIPINHKVNELVFLHTTGYLTRIRRKVGQYRINYSDNTNVTIDLIYGVNIHAWIDNVPSQKMKLAWRGLTKDGELIRIRSFRWQNPYPEKVIASIDFIGSEQNAVSPILLAITGLTSSGQ